MSETVGSDVIAREPEDYTHVIVSIKGGCVQGAQLEDGTPVLITVHDYDIHKEDIGRPELEVESDEYGDVFERLIA